MKKIVFFLLLFPVIAFSQIGINTTAPKAALDVESTNNGVLIPRVQLTSILDVTNVINPNGGSLETSTLVYNRNPAGIAPNDVVPGFYYWNNTAVPAQWIPVARGTNWNLNGNATIITPANPATYGTSSIAATENFIGTTDNNDVTIATNNIERMRVKNTTGNVGIGLATAPSKLSVFGSFLSPTFPNTTTNAMLRIGNNFEGLDIGKAGFVNNYSSWLQSGFNGFADPLSLQPLGGNVGIGTVNPVTNTEITSAGITELRLSSTIGFGASRFSMVSDKATVNEWRPAYLENADNGAFTGRLDFYTNGTGVANRFGSVRAMSVTNGNVGIGTTNPSTLLHVNTATPGAVRIEDGTQANNKVLTSDANGVGTWKAIGIDNIIADLSLVSGINISYTETANFRQTGASIKLPPGRYAVNVSMLLSTVPGFYTNSNEAFWVRSTFSDSNGINPTPSAYIVGSTLVSGNLIPSTLYSLITGMVVINNNTLTTRTFYYVAGRVVTNNSTRTIANFGGNYWAENNIIAYRLN